MYDFKTKEGIDRWYDDVMGATARSFLYKDRDAPRDGASPDNSIQLHRKSATIVGQFKKRYYVELGIDEEPVLMTLDEAIKRETGYHGN